MSLNQWQSGKLQAVFSPAGVHENGEARYARNNFDILKWQEPGASRAVEWVVSPTADSVPPGEEINAGDLLDEGLAQEFGFYELVPLLLEPFRNVGQGDSVQDLHFFGPV
jgi:hypothetical protein